MYSAILSSSESKPSRCSSSQVKAYGCTRPVMKNNWFAQSDASICWLYNEILRLKKMDGERESESPKIEAYSGVDSHWGLGRSTLARVSALRPLTRCSVRICESAGDSGGPDKGHHGHISADILLALQGLPSEGGCVLMLLSGSHCLKR